MNSVPFPFARLGVGRRPDAFHYLEVNAAYRELAGLPDSDDLPEDLPEALCNALGVDRSHQLLEILWPGPDGERWFQVRTEWITADEVNLYFWDVTAGHRTLEHWTSTTRTTRELICHFNGETRITFANDAFCAAFGYPREKVVGASILALTPPEKHQKIREKIESLGTTETHVEYLHRIPAGTPGGPDRWQEWIVYPLAPSTRDGEGTSLFQAIGHDITRWKVMEEKLTSILANILDVVLSASWPELDVLFVSPAMERLTGYPLDIFYRRRGYLDSLVLQEDRAALVAAREALGRSGHIDAEYRIRRSDGAVTWIRETGRLVQGDDSTPRVDGILRDITTRREIQLALGRQMEMQKVLTGISARFVAISSANRNMLLIEALRRMGEHMAVDRVSLVQYSRYGDTITSTHEWCAPVMNYRQIEIQEVEIASLPWLHRKLQSHELILVDDVTQLPPEASAERDFLLQGNVKTLLAVPVMDNESCLGFLQLDSTNARAWTEREIDGLQLLANILADGLVKVAAERRLLKEKERAENATRTKSDFLARMSHDIRTPMNAIVGFADLLLNTDMTTVQRRYLEQVQSSGKSLLMLINDILDFSRIEAGKLELNHTTVDLPDLLEEVLSLVKLPAEKKGLDLVMTVDPVMPQTILADPLRLNQILTNLLGNAVKFTEKGAVSLTCRLEAGAGDAGRRQDLGVFEVEDTGVGIPADRLEAIFDSFSQADNSTTRTYGGTGLGLSIARSLVERMGGTIAVTSTLGEGSCFRVKIPLEEMAGSAVHPEEDRSAVVGPPREVSQLSPVILFAEDNAPNVFLGTELLRRIVPNATVIHAANGAEAVELYRTRSPDLVLMDVQMPVMDGHEATRQIRAAAETEADVQGAGSRRVPIVALTAGAMQGDREACLAAGMDDYVTKPLTMESLRSSVMKWLEQGSGPGPEAPRGEAPPGATAPASSPPGSIKDMREVLRSHGHSDETIAEVLVLLRERLPELQQEIASALEADDTAQLARGAHSVRGILLTVGLVGLGEIAGAVEAAVGEGDPVTARENAKTLQNALSAIISGIAAG